VRAHDLAGSQNATHAGYDVIDIDLNGRIYRVEAYKPAGEKVKLLVRAEDGSILTPSDRHDSAVVVRDRRRRNCWCSWCAQAVRLENLAVRAVF